MKDEDYFYITLILKGGGYQKVLANADILGKIGEGIKKEGSYGVGTLTQTMEAVGVLVTGKDVSPGVIMLGTEGMGNE
ncbi:MAG: hypothetical protein ABS894_00955 [Aerococcus urinaeequi]